MKSVRSAFGGFLFLALLFGSLLFLTGCGGGGGGGGAAPTPSPSVTPTLTPTLTPTPPLTDLGYYDIGSPVLADIWVDAASGNDANDGNSRASALRTLAAAWAKIPLRTTLSTTGYRIRLCPGRYERADGEIHWLEGRYGTYAYPVEIAAADGPGTATLRSATFNDCRYVYLMDLTLSGGDANVLHLQGGTDHFLVRNVRIEGVRATTQEAVKANQCSNLFIEQSDVSGAANVALDIFGTYGGHIVNNRIHGADAWCIYLKGGTASFRVEANEIYEGGQGGFSAGDGSGFDYMVTPWLHYDAADIKCINNVVHDVDGAGLAVWGGYNVLLAHNTLYRVGQRSHAIEVVFGLRGCDEDPVRATANHTLGGWGPTVIVRDDALKEPIPDRHVYIFNNVLLNPSGYQSAWRHFEVSGPRTPGAGSNIPSPAVTDEDLRIRGNVLWNGPVDLPLMDEANRGCQPGNPTCNDTQLRADNAINTAGMEPQLVNPAGGNFRPVAGGSLYRATAFAIPAFPGGDSPQPPLPPAGELANLVSRDRDGTVRTGTGTPGAYQ